LKGVAVSLRNCGHIIWTQYQSSVVFWKYPFQNWAVHNVVRCTKSTILISNNSLFHCNLKSIRAIVTQSFFSTVISQVYL